MELYKQYRPRTLKEVIGNRATVATLKRMVDAKQVPQTILFHGPSGCGKTTLARIVCDLLGCTGIDFKEMNSSSYRGIDTVRELQSVATLRPMGEAKVYLLDEVHKLTGDAQNALLKLLEDTPKSTYFFLCTTEPDKLIKALRNRCTELKVELLAEEQMKELVGNVCAAESIELTDEACELLIEKAEGSARRALVLLDKARHFKGEQQTKVLQTEVTEASSPEVIELCRVLYSGKGGWPACAKILRDLKEEPESVRWAVLGYAKSILVKKADDRAFSMIQSFANHFYDSKVAGLVGSCYEVMRDE